MTSRCSSWVRQNGSCGRCPRATRSRFHVLHALIGQIEEDGWHLSVRSEVIKVLRPATRIGEIRDLGAGGYRLFFFWIDTWNGKDLLVTRVLPKRAVEGRARLNAVIAS